MSADRPDGGTKVGVGVSLAETIVARLDALAVERQRQDPSRCHSRSELVGQAVDQWLERLGAEETEEE